MARTTNTGDALVADSLPAITVDELAMPEVAVPAPVSQSASDLPDFTPPGLADGTLPLRPLQGVHLSTFPNTVTGRARAEAMHGHLCVAGEGYIENERLCETDPQTKELLYAGDLVVCWKPAAYVQLDAWRKEEAKKSVRDNQSLERDIAKRAAQDGERMAVT